MSKIVAGKKKEKRKKNRYKPQIENIPVLHCQERRKGKPDTNTIHKGFPETS
jgi:hypothetical protein